MRLNTCASILIVILASGFGGSARAQFDPWKEFVASDVSRCAVINAANAELVVSSATGEFILVTASDIILQDTFVDEQNRVFFENEPFGSIAFAIDGDGLLSLWWLTLTGTVVEIDALTAVPSATLKTPADFTGAGCDACDFWDDVAACEEPTVTVPICGVDVPITLPMIALGLGVMSFFQSGGIGRGGRDGRGQSGRGRR